MHMYKKIASGLAVLVLLFVGMTTWFNAQSFSPSIQALPAASPAVAALLPQGPQHVDLRIATGVGMVTTETGYVNFAGSDFTACSQETTVTEVAPSNNPGSASWTVRKAAGQDAFVRLNSASGSLKRYKTGTATTPASVIGAWYPISPLHTPATELAPWGVVGGNSAWDQTLCGFDQMAMYTKMNSSGELTYDSMNALAMATHGYDVSMVTALEATNNVSNYVKSQEYSNFVKGGVANPAMVLQDFMPATLSKSAGVVSYHAVGTANLTTDVTFTPSSRMAVPATYQPSYTGYGDIQGYEAGGVLAAMSRFASSVLG